MILNNKDFIKLTMKGFRSNEQIEKVEITMIEKHETNSFLFQETGKLQEKENGNENFRFYHKYLRQQIDKIKECRNGKSKKSK